MKDKPQGTQKFLIPLNSTTHQKISTARWAAKTSMVALINHVLDTTDWDAIAEKVARK